MNTSWQWAKLMELRETFNKGIIWKVGNGNTIKLWKDNGVQGNPLIDTLTPNNTIDLNEKVSAFTVTEKKWNTDRLNQLLPKDMVDQILDMDIPTSNIQAKTGCIGKLAKIIGSQLLVCWRR